MTDIAATGPSIGSTASGSASRELFSLLRGGATRPAAEHQSADRVDLSDHARHLERLRALPDVRSAKVDAIRESIARGTYDTPERMQAALRRLLDELTA